MVYPPVLHIPPMAQPISDASDRPPTPLGCQSTSHSLSWTLVCFYYPSLLDTLDYPCLHFDPRLSDSVSDSYIVADTVGTPQLDL